MLGCWTDNFSLNITDLNDIKNRDGVQTKVNDFGYVEGIGYLDKVRKQILDNCIVVLVLNSHYRYC